MQGTGNDFVMLDGIKDPKSLDLTKDQIRFLCDRRFGVGADGLIIIKVSPGLDFEMVYYNADGYESSMCGNGGRCIIKYALEYGYADGEAHFNAIDGLHKGHKDGSNISLKMSDVTGFKLSDQNYVLDTGSPHYVTFRNHIDMINVKDAGKGIRNQREFIKEGINVNFVEKVSASQLYVRTYERGVEAETLSCGTGVTAAAISSHLKFKTPVVDQYEIKTKGGTVYVKFKFQDDLFQEIYLTGPAEFVFSGTIVLL